MNISNELSCDDEEDQFLRSFSYPRTRCTFLPNGIPTLGEILVLFLVRRNAICVRVLHLDQGGGVTQAASVGLTSDTVSFIRPRATPILMLSQEVTDITFSESGNISLLCMVIPL